MKTLTEALGDPAKLAPIEEVVKGPIAAPALEIVALEESTMHSFRDMLL